MSTATGVFLLSLTAVPVCYSMNLMSSMGDHRLVFGGACLVLAVIVFMSYLIIAFTGKQNKPSDLFFYVFSLFAFTSVVDLVIGLELDGVINNFVAFYLKEGEPYLNTAYGTMINYWDGTGHYCMYLMMVTAIVWKLNVVFSFSQKIKAQKKSIFQRPFDLMMVIYLLTSCVFSFIRMLAALNSPILFAQAYVKFYEPYLLDPVIYPKLQMLVYWFYLTPHSLCAIYGLLYPGCEWMSDWALIHAGAAMQGQFSHIGSSLHSRTPYALRVPIDSRSTFWVINLILLVFPQILAWRCLNKPAFFAKEVDPRPLKKEHLK
ncbi:transmembrane 6 superfamily member 1-like [Anneissia japonica]|uniref:transmembrane 6 superfamily member 1-like n=1 Tax=Anneissia japonica TaxID=1529436 RepID=UPI0014259D0F|nr:transmembrane 6 superfamily member 1-like [Anneissia japonica]